MLSDLGRAQTLITEVSKVLSNIVLHEIQQLLSRYQKVFIKWKRTNFNMIGGDEKASSVIKKDGIHLGDSIKPIA